MGQWSHSHKLNMRAAIWCLVVQGPQMNKPERYSSVSEFCAVWCAPAKELCYSCLCSPHESVDFWYNSFVLQKNADAIIGWVTSKTTVVTDRHCVDNIGAPMDDEQSVYDIAGRKEDGYQIIEFTRKRDTQDPNGQNYVFGDQKCPFFLFPVVGGSYDSYGGIQAHSQKAKPKISAGRICVRSCNIGK